MNIPRLNRYRFLTYKCRRWLPCRSGKGPFHTHHLLLVIPPLQKDLTRG